MEFPKYKFEEGDTYFAVEPKENPVVDNFAYISQSCWDENSTERESNFMYLEEAIRYCKHHRLNNILLGLFEGYPIKLTINTN